MQYPWYQQEEKKINLYLLEARWWPCKLYMCTASIDSLLFFSVWKHIVRGKLVRWILTNCFVNTEGKGNSREAVTSTQISQPCNSLLWSDLFILHFANVKRIFFHFCNIKWKNLITHNLGAVFVRRKTNSNLMFIQSCHRAFPISLLLIAASATLTENNIG